MNNSINLLEHKNSPKPINNDVQQRKLRVIALSALFIVSASSIVFFILVALSPIPQLRIQEKSASFKLSRDSENIIKLALIKDRTENIKDIMARRPHYEIALENLQNKIPQGVTINSVELYKNYMTITLSSHSLLPLNNFIDKLIKVDSTGSEFSNIKLNSLVAEKNKNSFVLTLELNII